MANTKKVPQPADKGVYTLLIRLPHNVELRIADQRREFKSGYYVYTGRAMRGLSQRLKRHMRASKTAHWHVDRLLEQGKIVDIQVEFTDNPLRECSVAGETGDWKGAEIVRGFGASDCRCSSHLTFFARRPFFSLYTLQLNPFLSNLFRLLESSYRNHADDKRDPFRTLVTCVLSLRTRDPVTDAAAERLFQVLESPPDFLQVTPEYIEQLIYPVGMYRQKAKRLISLADILIQEHNGNVPADIESLTRLPGVGRKTATLVRSFAYHMPAVCVDTHVHRISNRLGLLRTGSVEETERALMELVPRDRWSRINPLLVQHGQNICRPVRPRCDDCLLQTYCGISNIRQQQHLLQEMGFTPTHPALKNN